ncbi:MAG: hypothetical protein KME19_24960 [Microcoleus vaginatus WJT46-NPBG5]|jgi:hypothetical protein|nr:hypothetical protein [Microcoleus vaginatus WJT46-NPBG5]
MKSPIRHTLRFLTAIFLCAASEMAIASTSLAQNFAPEFRDDSVLSDNFQPKRVDRFDEIHSLPISKKNRALSHFRVDKLKTDNPQDSYPGIQKKIITLNPFCIKLRGVCDSNSASGFPQDQSATHDQSSVLLSDEGLQQEIPEPAGKPPSLRLVTVEESQADPSISVAMPFASGLNFGSIGIGAGWQSRTRYTNLADGGLGIGIGLGNSQKFVGFDVVASILDVSDFARRGSLSFKIHRTLSDDFAVAVGVQNAIIWGFTDAGTSVYGVATKTFNLQESVEEPFSLLVISAGIGGGQFRSESDIYSEIDSVGVFGSTALRVVEPVNVIAEWTGQDLTLGLSYAPFQHLPIVVTGAVTDFTGNAGDGSRFLLRVGYSFSF